MFVHSIKNATLFVPTTSSKSPLKVIVVVCRVGVFARDVLAVVATEVHGGAVLNVLVREVETESDRLPAL